MWNKRTPPLWLGVQTCAVTIEINMAVTQKIGDMYSQDHGILLLGIFQKDVPLNNKDTY